jgi:8-oxo-dGTP pyrophosphatase MutT (NUDIX family)
MVTTAGIFIFDTTGKILICRPTGITTKDGWSIPKGKQEKGEEVIDAALRETFEETSLQLTSYKKKLVDLGIEKYNSKKKKLWGFAVKVNEKINVRDLLCVVKNNDGKIKIEIDLYEMVDPEEALDRIHYTQAKLLKKYLKEMK